MYSVVNYLQYRVIVFYNSVGMRDLIQSILTVTRQRRQTFILINKRHVPVKATIVCKRNLQRLGTAIW